MTVPLKPVSGRPGQLLFPHLDLLDSKYGGWTAVGGGRLVLVLGSYAYQKTIAVRF